MSPPAVKTPSSTTGEFPFQPTTSQTLALDMSRNLSVTAGAGTGKTWVLSERFVRLLEADEHLDPRRILAVTFTRKAAAEMRTRIADRIGKEIQAARQRGDAGSFARWIRHRRRLSESTITTIHGLSTEILRAYGLEAGIDPAFRVLEGAEQTELVEHAIRAAFRDIDQDNRPRLVATLADRGRRTLEGLIRQLFNDPAFADRFVSTLDRSDDASLTRFLLERLVPFDDPAACQAIEDITTAADWLLPPTVPPEPDSKQETFCRLLTIVHEATNADYAHRVAMLHTLYEHMRTKDGWKTRRGRSHVFGKQDLWDRYGGVDRAHALVDEIEQIFEGLIGSADFHGGPGPADAALFNDLRVIGDLYEHARDHYAEAKQGRGLLDFHDLQEQAARLMERPWLAAGLRRRWRHLLVDEFQDTDALQWTIISALAAQDPHADAGSEHATEALAIPMAVEPHRWNAAEAYFLGIVDDPDEPPATATSNEPDRERDLKNGETDALTPSVPPTNTADGAGQKLAHDRLFIVGDAKQSIYGFRGADITVYKASQDAILDANQHHGARHRDRRLPAAAPTVTNNEKTAMLGKVSLERNFRSRAPLVHFANHLFDQIMAPDDGKAHKADEAPPGGLEPHRNGAEAHKGSIRIVALARPSPHNAAARAIMEKEDPDHETAPWRRLAQQIVADVDGSRALDVHDKGTATERPADYDDCAILMARKRHVPDIVRELRALGVPYTVSGGRGFWDSQEVWDLYHLLVVLHDPMRELELVGILRSPLFAWTDDAIVRLWYTDATDDQPTGTAWSRLQRAARDDTTWPGATVTPREIVTHMTTWRANAGTGTIASLVADAVSTTGYVGHLAPDDRHRQAVHNVDHFIDKIRDLERRHGPRLSRIVNVMEAMLERDLDEAEAVLPPTKGQGVRILTVHAAKGLEFPIVYIPDLDRDHTRIQWGDVQGWTRGEIAGRRLLGAKGPDNDGRDADTLLAAALRDMSAQRQRAEAKRLFYVAVTRARDHLVLLGRTPRMMPDAVELHARQHSPPDIHHGRSWMDWLEHSLGLDRAAYIDTRSAGHTATIPFGETSVLLDVRAPAAEPSLRARSEPEDSRPIGPLPGETSPTRPLITLNPSGLERYVQCPRRFYHQTVEGVPEARPIAAQRRQDDHATLIGDLVHQALESGATTEKPLPLAVERRARRRAKALGRPSDTTIEHVRRNVIAALGALSTGGAAMHEVQIDHVIEGQIRVRGRIDHLEPSSATSTLWQITDHKTDDIGRNDGDTYGRAHGHDLQQRAYADMVERLSATRTEARLLYTQHGSFTTVGQTKENTRILDKIKRDPAPDEWPMRPEPNKCRGCGYYQKRGGPCLGPDSPQRPGETDPTSF